MWSFLRQPSEVAKAIASEFEAGLLTKACVSPHSISELGTTYLGKTVTVTWYPAYVAKRRLRTLSIDGSEAVFPESVDSSHIFKAALRRADRLIHDKMAELETLRATQASNNQ